MDSSLDFCKQPRQENTPDLLFSPLRGQLVAINDGEEKGVGSLFRRALPPVLHDADEGIADALRRDAELETDPSVVDAGAA